MISERDFRMEITRSIEIKKAGKTFVFYYEDEEDLLRALIRRAQDTTVFSWIDVGAVCLEWLSQFFIAEADALLLEKTESWVA